MPASNTGIVTAFARIGDIRAYLNSAADAEDENGRTTALLNAQERSIELLSEVHQLLDEAEWE